MTGFLKNIAFSLLFCLSLQIFGQKTDSLSDKSNRYLVSKIDSLAFEKGSDLVQTYVQAYIKNNKSKENRKSLFYAYNIAVFHFPDLAQEYADSALWAAEMTKDEDQIGNALYERAGLYYDNRQYKNALDEFLKADAVLSRTQNSFLKSKVNYSIGVIRLYLGHYDDALEDFKTTESYFETVDNPDHQRMLMRSLYRLGEVYQQTGEYKQAAATNLLGLHKATEQGEKYQIYYFNLAAGIDQYFAGDYKMASDYIEKALPTLENLNDFDVVQKAYYYLGRAHLDSGNKQKALQNFGRVDSLFVKNGFLNPQARGSYEWLIDYYRESDDKDKQLYYINQLLSADQINANNLQGLAYTLKTEYDTKRLEEAKSRLERRFNNWNYIWMGLLISLLGFIFFFFKKFRKTNKEKALLQQRFDALMNPTDPEQRIVVTKERTNEISKKQEIPSEVVETILHRLQKFEDEKEFLNPKVDLNYLAKKFGTNRSYLSKIINEQKGKGFMSYLYGLRIEYVIELLKNEPEYREYTIKTLAALCGFSGYRHFSDAFMTETGLRPQYFLEQIKKEKAEVF
ncbi:MAG: helix-turn-helix domain-containing protein [Moheibacter sp.]